jgi:transcriptional regulator with XRE-family HTH domain
MPLPGVIFIKMKVRSQGLSAVIGGRLRLRRKTLGILQEDLAALAGIAVHTLSNVESGRGNPSLDVLERLLDCLGLAVTIEPRPPSGAKPRV